MSYMDIGREASPQMQKSPADRAATICRSLIGRDDARQSFDSAFQMAVANGKSNVPIDAEKFGTYSLEAMKYTKRDSQWQARFANESRIHKTDQMLQDFYQSVQKRGALTISGLASLYDQLSMNEVLFDGNTRNRILALAHITAQYGYPPPDFTRTSYTKLMELQKQYPRDHQKATLEFLRDALPIMPLT